MPLRTGQLQLPPVLGLLPFILALVLTGCGFQLRGQMPVPAALEPLAVECTGQVPQELCNILKEQLSLGDIELVDAEEAAHVLRLDNFNEQRRASAITLQASAAEYDLRQSVAMSVIASDQVPLLADVDVRSSDTYRYDETNVLAKRREEQDIRTSLYERLAQQVIFRLAPLSRERIDSLRQQQSTATESDQGQ
ncbi:LPS assembly lipoprotein LptE [Marinobacter salicampi]|uniref:LPS-assembly lipoprotein LptE n=1 Tax=Marinobacter salicampi TaxID=435907 RepID=UPI00140CDD51|nr:LPS assembly lipoprotein LptE [Marinobacter salicampi]